MKRLLPACVCTLVILSLFALPPMARAQTETARARPSCLPPPAGLTGWWPGDGDASDLAGGRPGVMGGGARFGPGLVGQAFQLDGAGGFVEVPHDPALDLGAGDFTIDLWVTFRDTTGEQVLMEKWIQSDVVDGWTLTKLDSQVLRLAVDSGGGVEADLDSGVLDFVPDRWYHVAAVRHGSAVRLFVNGAVVAEQAGLSASDLSAPVSLKFGHRGGSDDTPGSTDPRGFYLNGQIDEVDLFAGTALSADQVREIYQAGGAGKCKAAHPPPALSLRVNYGHDWVESFYEAGHRVRVVVTASDGATVKAAAAVVTEPKDFWGGETGFTTSPEDWQPAPPDIQPYDWVYAWVDNGAQARVRLGEIRGEIDLAADGIRGAVLAPWASDAVTVECHPWGAPQPQPEVKIASVRPDGADPYTCAWSGEWDIQPDQDVGVGYTGADGHWVANAFFVPNAYVIASTAGDWFWTTGFTPGRLAVRIYESDQAGAALLWQGNRLADASGFIWVGYEDHGLDLVPGRVVAVSSAALEKRLVLEAITMEVFDPEADVMAGTAPAGRLVTVVAGLQTAETQGVIFVTADPATGAWRADFRTIGFDITEPMRAWSFAQIHDADGDASEAGTPAAPPAL